VEIELLDQAGKPVPNEPYQIELPDGSTTEGNLDSQGQARVDGIDPGNCKISFPNIDKKSWRKK
jgi:type VI secretion system secreted protein VgrG